jgi:hypothetical protein
VVKVSQPSYPHLVRRLSQRYELEIAGVRCWTPYWINWDEPPYFKDAPYRGKGTPQQITTTACQLLATSEQQPRTPEAMRGWMRQQGLGIDCSGFAYHVLNAYLRQRLNVTLAAHLRVYQADICAALKRHPDRADPGLGRALPWLRLEQVCQVWRKEPAMLTDVRRLTDPTVAHPVERADQVQPGDLIKLTSRYGDHIAIVCGRTADTIEYASSEDEPDGLGGIRCRQIQIGSPREGLEAQQWEQAHIYNPGQNNDGAWRLPVLEGVT